MRVSVRGLAIYVNNFRGNVTWLCVRACAHVCVCVGREWGGGGDLVFFNIMSVITWAIDF